MTTAALRHYDPPSLGNRLRNAQVMTQPLMLETSTRRVGTSLQLGQIEPTARVTRLIEAEAWADAAH